LLLAFFDKDVTASFSPIAIPIAPRYEWHRARSAEVLIFFPWIWFFSFSIFALFFVRYSTTLYSLSAFCL